MHCPGCQEPVPADAALRFCQSCGASLPSAVPVQAADDDDSVSTPPRLEVEQRRLLPHLHGLLQLRCGLDPSETRQQVELLFEPADGLVIDEGVVRRLALSPGADCCWAIGVRGEPGSHLVHVTARAGGARWQGQFVIEFAHDAPPAPIQIIGAQDQREGQYLLGDNRVEMTVHLPGNQSVPLESAYRRVELSPLDDGALVRTKRIFERQQPLGLRRISLMIGGSLPATRICLLAGQRFVLGRNRRVDLRLRCPATGDSLGAAAERISREHAVIEFLASGAVWLERSTVGTRFVAPGQPEGHLRAGQRVPLRTGLQVSPAGVLPLRARVVRQAPARDEAAHRWFVEHLLGVEHEAPVGPDAAVCLRRLDTLADLESYVLFQQAILVGSGPDCAVHLPHASVAPRHALLLHLAGSFWLEPLTASYPTHFDGRPVPRDHLLPLAPNHLLRLGEVEVTVAEFAQAILDD